MAKGRKAAKNPTVNKTAEGFKRIPLEITEKDGDTRVVLVSCEILQIEENAAGIEAAAKVYSGHGGEDHDGMEDVARNFNSAQVNRARSHINGLRLKLADPKNPMTQEEYEKALAKVPQTLFVPSRSKSAEERVLDKYSKDLHAVAREGGVNAAKLAEKMAALVAELRAGK